MDMNFNTTNSTFRQLLGNGLRYRVRHFNVTTHGQSLNGMSCGKILKRYSVKTQNLRIIWVIWCYKLKTVSSSTL